MDKLILTSTDKNVILDLDKEGRVTMKKRTMTDEQLREIVKSDTVYSVPELREFLGLSQTKFGEKYDIPHRTIQEWEKTAKDDSRERNSWVLKLLNRVVKEDIKHELRYGKRESK